MQSTFKPNWKLALFTLFFMPVLISFGFWQLDREQEKTALQTNYEMRLQAPEVELELVDIETESPAFLKVKATGSYDTQRSFLLDNRIREGSAGFEVITPFRTDEDELILINRGWVAQGSSRDNLPAIPTVEGNLEIRGSIYVPVGEQFMLGSEEATEQWPRLVQRIDMPAFANSLTEPDIFPYTVRLADDSPGALTTGWQLMNMMPEKHRAYAVQWFVMAAVLLLLFLYASIRHPEVGDSQVIEPGKGSSNGTRP